MARLLNRKSARKFLERFPALRYVEWSIEAFLIWSLWFVAGALRPDRASKLGGNLMRNIGPCLNKNRHVQKNLSIIFPNKTDAEINSLASGVWSNFGSVLAEFPHLATLLQNKDQQYITVHVDQESQSIIDSGNPAIFVVPHLGNWELVAGIIVSLGIPMSAIFSPQNNPLLDRMIQTKRKASKCKFITKHSALRAMFRELNDGRFIGLLPDQRVDSGNPVPFCEVDALTTTSPARVAIRFNCAIIPVRMERLDGCRFKTRFLPPIKPNEKIVDNADRAYEMTVRINKLIATWIHERPEQWLCMKRRWPKVGANQS